MEYSWIITKAYFILSFFLLLGFCLVIHEFGHYLAYRALGIVPEVFSIGVGTEVFAKKDTRGTVWRVALFPFGAYVGSSVWPDRMLKQIFVAVAGPVANFVSGFILCLGLLMFCGCSTEVVNDKLCLKVGNASIVYQANNDDVSTGYVTLGAWDAVRVTSELFVSQYRFLKRFVTLIGSDISGAASKLSSPIGLLMIVSNQQMFLDLMFATAQIAFSLGMMNLLPIFPLDGGRILFAIIGINPDENSSVFVQVLSYLSYFVLMMFFVFSVFNDIEKLNIIKNLKKFVIYQIF